MYLEILSPQTRRANVKNCILTLRSSSKVRSSQSRLVFLHTEKKIQCQTNILSLLLLFCVFFFFTIEQKVLIKQFFLFLLSLSFILII